MGVESIVGLYEATPTSTSDGKERRVGITATGAVRTVSDGAIVGGGITYTDKTITSASGSSQTLAASNASRKSIIIKNGASVTGVNINGGTAVIGGAATLVLQPYEGLSLSGADCPVGAITVISTAAAYISAFEGA